MKTLEQHWFVAEVVERAAHNDKNENSPKRRLLTWVDTLIVRAESISEAYDKTLKIAKKNYTTKYKAVEGNNVQWMVLGLSSLKQIDGGLKDGSEIFWADKGYISVNKSNSMVKSKKQLISD